MPEARDSDFSWSEFVRRNNDELVAAWGNLANRVLSFAYKHWEGFVPEPGTLRRDDKHLLEKVESSFDTVGEKLSEVKLRAALNEALALAREVNAYLDQAPWFSVIKEDRQAAATTVYTALRAIDSLKILFSPFLPFSSEQLHQTLGYEGQLFGEQHIETFKERERTHEALVYDPSKATGRWEPSQLKPGQTLNQPSPLFPKLEEELIEEERGRLGQPRD